ncbi:MAG TPA: GntR family transcriptional regulator [Chloroflexota bacterium]|nr:GntR family transcriptional regulator [Chloroflexota bacterium]
MARGAAGSLARRAYEALKQDILTCTLAPGAQIFEAELAARYGTSKTPVREALNLLRQEGLVQVLPRRGYLVAPVTLRDVQEVFQLRLLLETAAAELAAEHITEDGLCQLKALVGVRYTYRDRASYARFLRANREFHVAVAEASGNRRLAAFVAKLLEDMERILHLGLDLRDSAEEMAAEHQELVDALLKGDAELARRVVTEQLQNSRKRVLEALVASMGAADGIRLVPG